MLFIFSFKLVWDTGAFGTKVNPFAADIVEKRAIAVESFIFLFFRVLNLDEDLNIMITKLLSKPMILFHVLK